jgi:hypothetical protein
MQHEQFESIKGREYPNSSKSLPKTIQQILINSYTKIKIYEERNQKTWECSMQRW